MILLPQASDRSGAAFEIHTTFRENRFIDVFRADWNGSRGSTCRRHHRCPGIEARQSNLNRDVGGSNSSPLRVKVQPDRAPIHGPDQAAEGNRHADRANPTFYPGETRGAATMGAGPDMIGGCSDRHPGGSDGHRQARIAVTERRRGGGDKRVRSTAPNTRGPLGKPRFSAFSK